MTVARPTWLVVEGQSFAGGILTAQGVNEVNAHRIAVHTKRKESVSKKVIDRLIGRIDMKPEEKDRAIKALNTTPW